MDCHGAAKTVSFSPMRGSSVIFKNTLDSPGRLKWPEISAENAAVILQKLKRSLTGMKPPVRKKSKGKQMQQKEDVQPSIPNKEEVSIQEDKPTYDEPPVPKKLCSRTSLTGTLVEEKSLNWEKQGFDNEKQATIDGEGFDLEKRSQAVIGINAVSRQLERGNLRAGLVCSSTSLMHQHLIMLAATRGTPFISLSALAETIAPLLGLKSAMAIGFRKLKSDEHDNFTELVAVISHLAPPLNIPWLSIRADKTTTSTTDDMMRSKQPCASKIGADSDTGIGNSAADRWFEPDSFQGNSKPSPVTTERRLDPGKSPGISEGRLDPGKSPGISEGRLDPGKSPGISEGRLDPGKLPGISEGRLDPGKSPGISEGRLDPGQSPGISNARKTRTKSRKRKRGGRSQLATLATPEVQYFPVNVKKTIIRPKSRMKTKS